MRTTNKDGRLGDWNPYTFEHPGDAWEWLTQNSALYWGINGPQKRLVFWDRTYQTSVYLDTARTGRAWEIFAQTENGRWEHIYTLQQMVGGQTWWEIREEPKLPEFVPWWALDAMPTWERELWEVPIN